MPEISKDPFQFWEELKRRRVIRVITVYAATAFVLLELVDIISEPFGLPDWTLKLVAVLLVIGFIISVILSWIYDVTPEGIQKTKPSKEVASVEAPPASKGWRIATFVSVLIIIAFVVFYIVGINKKSFDISKLEKSIAVLPLEYLSEDSNKQYLADGVLDAITGHLSKIEGLRVMPRTSVEQYRENKKSAKEIGEELDVSYLIEGSFFMVENQVKLIIQLVVADEETHVFFKEYDRNYSDIMAVQSEVAQTITKEIEVVITPEEKLRIESIPTENLEAYDLYLKGRYFWNKRTENGIKEAIEYYNLAIEKDENYALAWAGLADCYIMVATYMYISSIDGIRNNMQKAKDAAIKALKIDNSLAEAYTTLGYVKLSFDWDWNGALKDFEQAIRINPRYATAHQWYANVFTTLNKHDKAIAEAKLAQEIDPFSPITNRNVGRRLYLAHRYDEAITESLKALQIQPDFFPTLWTLSLSYLQKGMFSESILEMEKALRYSADDLYIKALLGHIYGAAGNQVKAQLILDEVIEASKNKYVPGITFAIIYIGLKDNNNALNWLDKAYEERTNKMIYLNTNPIYDPLHSEPRFIELLKKIGFEE